MDTENRNKWWYSLPESIRLKLSGHGITDIWQEPDTSLWAALYRYALLRAVGTEKNKDEERSLLNEAACGLSDLVLVRNNGMALEDMCNEDGEFLEEYQEQFDRLYDHYEETLVKTDWATIISHTEMPASELVRLLEKFGYKRVNIDMDRGVPKNYYIYRGGLHINATENLSFHIMPQKDSLGLGRFAVCAVKNGAGSQLGTDHVPFFFQRLFAFLKGEKSEKEIIDEVCDEK
ncbi:hypothetical protein QUW14_04145 [Bacteroides gallinaceum]|uniref:hypothetical protein n=1 Tax=Bacteroides gallinaceum TaxID=1462571 RepID=UPI0025A330F2|nr:hypothetical protein [Bacteroides gallinaceum]MDM8153513.1 hypothetical protein [Bacteroides gallinaceum]